MWNVNRENPEDAQKVVDGFIADESIKYDVLSFLCNAIIYANGLNQHNWNLNLDKNGGFVRFNVGHEYCIEIFKGYISVLALKEYIKKKLIGNPVDIEFKGYTGKKKVIRNTIEDLPDCLVKVPNSVACHVKHGNAIQSLPYLEEANRQFIAYAINHTVQLPTMNKAHSTGFMTYLSQYCAKPIPNPAYIDPEEEFYRIQHEQEHEATRLSIPELIERIHAKGKREEPTRTSMVAYRFKRNPYIVEYTKRRANGRCQDCQQPAPFINKLTNEPFLETHHIRSLADGGEDTIENTIALCPNCHRKRHYG